MKKGSRKSLGIGLLGLGVVGGGVARALLEQAPELAARAGLPLELKKVLVRHSGRKRPVPARLLTTQAEAVLAHPQVDIVVEVMGGEQPALDYIRRALMGGKQVVTANKEVMAKHGPELLALAAQQGRRLLFEASVGGGIPIIAPLSHDLLGNRLFALRAIINGTTNYILTRMDREGLAFAEALRQAQALGYAEANPADDIEGTDAAYKLAILASLAFHTRIGPEQVYREGIARLAPRDFRYARELGYAIKLLAIAKDEGGAVEARVHPALVPEAVMLAKVDGVFNAIQVEGEPVGNLLFYGRGAGANPTTSAVLGDILRLARDLAAGVTTPGPVPAVAKALRPMAEVRTRSYMRLSVNDQPGVLAQIARVLGDRGISIASVIQKEVNEAAGSAEIVIMTHSALEAALQRALGELAMLPTVREVSNFLRVEG